MRLCFFIVFLFFSCASEKSAGSAVVARVNNTTLTKEDLSRLVGDRAVDPKTALRATKSWVEKTLLYDAAVGVGLKKDKSLIDKKESFYKDLLVSSYLTVKTKNTGLVLRKEVSDYYKKNKKSFSRASEEIVVKHFVCKTKNEANSIKKTIKKNKRGGEIEKILKKYNPETRFFSEDLKKDSFIGFVFKAEVGEIAGPKKQSGHYHLFEVLKKHKKGSVRGLELVYDEIYQRLYKQKEMGVLAGVLDSLYVASDVFISPEVFE